MAKNDKMADIDLSKYNKADTDLDAFPDHNWESDPVLIGKVVKKKSAKVQRKNAPEKVDTRLMIVETTEGKVTLWEAATLAQFFDAVQVGDQIVVEATGKTPLGGGKSAWEFDAYYRSDA